MRIEPIPEGYPAPRAAPEGMTPVGSGYYHSVLMVGAMRSGKTVALLNLLRAFEKVGSYDFVWYISRTKDRDPKVKAVLGKFKRAKVKVFDDSMSVQGVMDEISRLNDEFEALADYLPVWRAYQAAERRDRVHALTREQVAVLEAHGYREPQEIYPDVADLKEEPVHALVLDDMLGSDELSTRNNTALNRLISIHRHLRTNVYISLQAFSQSLSPALRASMNMFCLWRCKSHRIQKAMAESLAGHVSESEFIRLWDEATAASRHDFLTVDLSTDQVFFKNFRQEIRHGGGVHPGRHGEDSRGGGQPDE